MLADNEVLIAEVAQTVLETMVFASSERAELFPNNQSESYLRAEITYSGSRNGELVIMAPKPLCRDWAEMMAGEDSPELANDMLGELANIIGGNWLARSFTAGETIKLNPPKVINADATHWDTVNRELAVVLSVEDNPFLLHVNTRD